MRYQWGQPIKYFEYSAAGLPVAFSDLAAKRRLIERIGNGILVDPSNPSKTAHKIAALLRDGKKMDVMAEKGRQAFLNEFNWERVEPDMLATIDKLNLN
jgi:glycosyltransferase involved in cell wall biosynthesis